MKNSPEGNSLPLSKFIFPSSFKERATLPIKLVPSAYKELKDLCIPDAPISVELAAVLSSQSWFKSKDEYHELSIVKPQYEEDMTDEEYLSNIMSYLTMSLRTDTDIAPIIPKNEELTPAIHKLRTSTIPTLQTESIIVENFGSYYGGLFGSVHQRIVLSEGKGIKLADKLKGSILNYFDSYQEIYTFTSNLIQMIDEALTKSTLRITGLYTKDKNALYANYTRGLKMPYRIVKTSLSIPMSYLFKDPMISFKVNSNAKGIPYEVDHMHIVDSSMEYHEIMIDDLDMTQDAGDRIVKRMYDKDVYYKKAGNSSFLDMSILANMADPLSVPYEDLNVVIVESSGFFTTTIHTQENIDANFDVLTIDEIMSRLTDGTLDSTSLQSFAVDNILETAQKRIDTEEFKIPEPNLEEDPMSMFRSESSQKHSVSIESRMVEVTDDMLKRLIISCRDGYFLKYCMAEWVNSGEDFLFETHYLDEIKGSCKVFQSKMVALCYSKINSRSGKIKYPNELRVLATQVFESPPMIKTKFTRENNILYISASILKLAQLSLEMYNSKDWSVSSMYTIPLLIISLSFGS